MPELPEVETVCRGIEPYLVGCRIQQVVVRQAQLRWPITDNLNTIVAGLTLQSISRRGKYLLLSTSQGTLLIHLGMSGSLRIVNADQPIGKHDHVDIIFTKTLLLRYNDPRRFGAILWTALPINQHPLLKNLGPEPLLPDFTAEYLHTYAKNRKTPIKTMIMDSHVVVGVGNIYANEALFLAGLHPNRLAGTIDLACFVRLVECIRLVLSNAIQQGGTTLRDFVNENGKPGYFQQQLRVYGRAGLPCIQCQQRLEEIRLSNRSTVFCSNCQH